MRQMVILAFIILNTHSAFGSTPLNLIRSPHIKETGNEIRVMVIDTGIDAKNPIIRHFIAKNEKLNSNNYYDVYGHGTAIAGTILYGALKYKRKKVRINGNNLVCNQVRLYSCSYLNYDHLSVKKNEDALKKTLNCYKEALKERIDLINYSGGGRGFSEQEYKDILKLQKNNIFVIAAAGNSGEDASKYPYYPASLSLRRDVHNVYPVGSLNKQLKKSYFSNYGLYMVWEIGENVLSPVPPKSLIPAQYDIHYYHYKYDDLNGTSQATAIYTHKLLLKKCKEINKGE